MKKKIIPKKNILIILLFILSFLFLYLNSTIGWYGYEKWKYRRDTYGDIAESKKRNVFVKDLSFSSSIKVDSFRCYIEKGFWFGKNNMNDTEFKFTKYPYQLSFNGIGNNRYLKISNEDSFDSITNENFQRPCIYLSKSELEHTVVLKIMSFKTRDSIGYIKIWDNDIKKK